MKNILVILLFFLIILFLLEVLSDSKFEHFVFPSDVKQPYIDAIKLDLSMDQSVCPKGYLFSKVENTCIACDKYHTKVISNAFNIEDKHVEDLKIDVLEKACIN